MENYFKAFRHYADFNGRASRKEYWMFFLFHIAAIFAIALLGTLVGMIIDKYEYQYYAIIPIMMYYALTAIPFLALTMRRLHDSGKSGWWLLLGLTSALYTIVVNSSNVDEEWKIITGALVIAAAVCMLVFMLLAGDKDTNKYGERPENIGSYGWRLFEKSAGLTMVIGASIGLISDIYTPLSHGMPAAYFLNIAFLMQIVCILAIMATGILLLMKQDRMKTVGILLLASGAISVVYHILILLFGRYAVLGYNIIYILFNLTIALTGVALIQQSINRQFINININTAAICLLAATSAIILLTLVWYMLTPRMDLTNIQIYNDIFTVSFIVFARYLLLRDTLQYESNTVGRSREPNTYTTQTIDIPNGRMHFAFAIINIIIGILFFFSCIVSLLVETADTISMVVLMVLSIFLWIVGFVYLFKRASNIFALRVLNIIAAVISFILLFFLIVGIIIIISHIR
ncbi:MAG: DUF805 domain-containing protein [Prevotellaceae bacterium]|jgi:uncharacterized membrane protein YhaH (DUF805 family)|nr:DUF805 domain-containing protein [Prevotellaceae bacterium]